MAELKLGQDRCITQAQKAAAIVWMSERENEIASAFARVYAALGWTWSDGEPDVDNVKRALRQAAEDFMGSGTVGFIGRGLTLMIERDEDGEVNFSVGLEVGATLYGISDDGTHERCCHFSPGIEVAEPEER